MIDSGDSVITNANGMSSVSTVPQFAAITADHVADCVDCADLCAPRGVSRTKPHCREKGRVERNRLNLDGVGLPDKHFSGPI